MMIQILMWLSIWISLATGLGVLAFGDWTKFKLKYLGVAFSTASVVYIIALQYAYPSLALCIDGPEHPCAQIHMFFFMRNVSIMIFHITSGRDAIKFKRCDRRSCAFLYKAATNDG